MRFAASALLLASASLAACTSMPAAPGYNDRQVTMAPVYCYKTLAEVDCYDQPQPSEYRRLVSYDDPIRWQQETEAYRARYRNHPNAPQPSRGVAASNAPPMFGSTAGGPPEAAPAKPAAPAPAASSSTAPARPAVNAQPLPTISGVGNSAS